MIRPPIINTKSEKQRWRKKIKKPLNEQIRKGNKMSSRRRLPLNQGSLIDMR